MSTKRKSDEQQNRPDAHDVLRKLWDKLAAMDHSAEVVDERLQHLGGSLGHFMLQNIGEYWAVHADAVSLARMYKLPEPPAKDESPWQTHADLVAWCGELLAEAEATHTKQGSVSNGIGIMPPANDDGSPFYKPAYFKKWYIGDELLRKNAISSKKYTPGKIRRKKQPPRTGSKGKRSTYWYSEPDVQKAWPDRFATAKN